MHCYRGKMVNILRAEELKKILEESASSKEFYEAPDAEVIEYTDSENNCIIVYWKLDLVNDSAIRMRFFNKDASIDTIDLTKINDDSEYNGDYKVDLKAVWDEQYVFGQYIIDVEDRDLRVFNRETYGR